jgi:hypothetical protein
MAELHASKGALRIWVPSRSGSDLTYWQTVIRAGIGLCTGLGMAETSVAADGSAQKADILQPSSPYSATASARAQVGPHALCCIQN